MAASGAAGGAAGDVGVAGTDAGAVGVEANAGAGPPAASQPSRSIVTVDATVVGVLLPLVTPLAAGVTCAVLTA